MKPHQQLSLWLSQNDTDAILVTKPENIGYLTGFWGSFGVYVQTKEKRLLLTDGRYATLGNELSATNGFELVIYKGGNPQTLIEAVNGMVGFEDSLSVARLKGFKKWFKGCKFKPQSEVVEGFRQIKTAAEVQIVRAAHAHVDSILIPFLETHLRTGVTERQLKFYLDQALQSEGTYGLSFDSIVGFGPGSALPHYESGDRALRLGDNILIDCGVVKDRYCSDMTRNFVFGAPTPEYLADYKLLLKAQQNTLKKVKAGVRCKTLDSFCRKEMGTSADLFTHSLGHGVGLEIHEAPTLSGRSKQSLQAGEIVTVEPGIYRAEQFGIRIEDTMVVTNSGADILTHTTKDLLTFNEKGEVQSLVKAA